MKKPAPVTKKATASKAAAPSRQKKAPPEAPKPVKKFNKVSSVKHKVSKNAGFDPSTVKSASKIRITDKQRAFVDEYLVDLNGTLAAIRAGYSAHTAAQIANENLRKPQIVALIAERQRDRASRVEIKQDDVLRVLLNMMVADANDLVEHRRHCCRFCWGRRNKYQRTANEMEAARIDHAQRVLKQQADPQMNGQPLPEFNEMGGEGYDERRGPNEDCPECFGDGVGKTIIKDTRHLAPAARALYAGVKQTKDGIEVKMQAKDTHLQLLMRHMGMLNDKVKLQGDVDNPLTLLYSQITGTPMRPTGGKSEE